MGLCLRTWRTRPNSQVLTEFEEEINGALILAHNASFDMSVLRASLDHYGEPYPSFDYLCTVKVAARAWPEMASHSLDVLAAKLGIDLDHHNAGSDAAASALVAAYAARELGSTDLSEMAQRLGIELGRLQPNGYAPCSARRRVKARNIMAEQSSSVAPAVQLACLPANGGRAITGKTIVITGELGAMTRETALRRIASAGGVVQDGVNKHTDFLVVGGQGPAKAINAGRISGKLAKAFAWREKGRLIELLSEDDLLRLLDEVLTEPC